MLILVVVLSVVLALFADITEVRKGDKKFLLSYHNLHCVLMPLEGALECSLPWLSQDHLHTRYVFWENKEVMCAFVPKNINKKITFS